MTSINFKVIGLTLLELENVRSRFEAATFGFPDLSELEAATFGHPDWSPYMYDQQINDLNDYFSRLQVQNKIPIIFVMPCFMLLFNSMLHFRLSIMAVT